VAGWYKKEVGERGNYYHQKVILPNLLRLLNLKPGEKVIDLGCGQGVLGRAIPAEAEYTGVDAATDLINEAKSLDKNLKHRYMVGDITEKLSIADKFNKAVILLTLQNLKRPFKAIENAKNLLKDNGRLFIVINHPCFRIPKHGDWETDREKGVQWRKTDVYMSHLEIPIESSPFDKKDNQITFSYHYPLSTYMEMLSDNGLVIEKIEEWVSDKKSEGGMAKIEDRARKEFPLFMALVAYQRQGSLGRCRREKNLYARWLT